MAHVDGVDCSIGLVLCNAVLYIKAVLISLTKTMTKNIRQRIYFTDEN